MFPRIIQNCQINARKGQNVDLKLLTSRPKMNKRSQIFGINSKKEQITLKKDLRRD
jgi:hypothetical protein